jgi:hypothetical protein
MIMPFYFRVPLPGPFGYSQRIGGKRRKRRPAPRTPASRAPASSRTYTATFGEWECSHHHATPAEAQRCGLTRQLVEYEQLERELDAVEVTTEADAARAKAMREHFAERKRQTIAEMEAL